MKFLFNVFYMFLICFPFICIGQDYYTHPKNEFKKFPFSEGVKIENTVYLSGQIGIPPGKKKLVNGGIEAETIQIMKNIGFALKYYGLSYRNIFKCVVMLADINEWKKFNNIYKKFFSAPYPARSAFGTNGLAFNARVELECIAR